MIAAGALGRFDGCPLGRFGRCALDWLGGRALEWLGGLTLGRFGGFSARVLSGCALCGRVLGSDGGGIFLLNQ